MGTSIPPKGYDLVGYTAKGKPSYMQENQISTHKKCAKLLQNTKVWHLSMDYILKLCELKLAGCFARLNLPPYVGWYLL